MDCVNGAPVKRAGFGRVDTSTLTGQIVIGVIIGLIVAIIVNWVR